MTTAEVTCGLIYKKILEVMKNIEAISKSRDNKVQGYKFRGIDDVYNELHEHLASAGVFSVPEILEDRTEEKTTKQGSALIYRILKIKYTFFAEDGSNIVAIVIGEGMDSGDKATNKAMSVAHKYALMQIFAIPTEEAKDPEVDSPRDLLNSKTLKEKDDQIRQLQKALEEAHTLIPKFNKNNEKQRENIIKYLGEKHKFIHAIPIEIMNDIDRLTGTPFSTKEIDNIVTKRSIQAIMD